MDGSQPLKDAASPPSCWVGFLMSPHLCYLLYGCSNHKVRTSSTTPGAKAENVMLRLGATKGHALPRPGPPP
jgi:hypothetical protein